VDVPFEEGENEGLRSDTVYGKGSLGFLAIRKEIGAEAFDAALREIADRYAWAEMTPEQLLTAFEDVSGKDLHLLWNHWFNEPNMTSEEIDAVTAAFA
jgi:aminopeptidase N